MRPSVRGMQLVGSLVARRTHITNSRKLLVWMDDDDAGAQVYIYTLYEHIDIQHLKGSLYALPACWLTHKNPYDESIVKRWWKCMSKDNAGWQTRRA